ncbi:unnamed protein product [Cuscuta campestris]|uniref:HNH nuclease domain-containing protein n=1 Tax=Cuscuta campestris TaxID=132261 RepID=A0A484LJA5_9ASTE|nr:unnamed protein product [Cuscuta campestris]
MRRRNEEGKRRNRYASTPPRTRPETPPGSARARRISPPPAAGSLIDSDAVTEELSSSFHDLRISSDFEAPNPRSFPYSVKQQCWEKAEKVKGRDPDRWRRDALGNTVFRKLVGCPGCLCYDYDHIIPYSKGGKSTLENCQVLQARVNRSKGNRTEMSKAELIQKSSYCRVSGRDMDLVELTSYGDVHRGQEDAGGCNIQ